MKEQILDWYKRVTALDEAWESWRMLGVQVEAPFPNAAWELATAYTKLVEQSLGLDDEWLYWFLYEKPNGPSKVKLSDKSVWEIDTIEDLIAMLEHEAREVKR